MYNKERALRDHEAELCAAIDWKRQGCGFVDAITAGESLAAGRFKVPIDEYIQYWHDRLDRIKAGEDPELFNY